MKWKRMFKLIFHVILQYNIKKLILINPELEVGLNADLLFSTQALEDNEKDLASQHSQTR